MQGRYKIFELNFIYADKFGVHFAIIDNSKILCERTYSTIQTYEKRIFGIVQMAISLFIFCRTLK